MCCFVVSFAGHAIEYAKIVKQTSTLSYLDITKQMTNNFKRPVGLLDGYLPWGGVQVLPPSFLVAECSCSLCWWWSDHCHVAAHTHMEFMMRVSRRLPMCLSDTVYSHSARCTSTRVGSHSQIQPAIPSHQFSHVIHPHHSPTRPCSRAPFSVGRTHCAATPCLAMRASRRRCPTGPLSRSQAAWAVRVSLGHLSDFFRFFFRIFVPDFSKKKSSDFGMGVRALLRLF
jgi:hypothetical protein